MAASYSYSYSYSYDIIYDVSYSYSFETMAPTPAAVAAVSLNMGYTMAPLSASKSPAWVDFWASETYYGYMGDEEEMATHAYTMVSVAFGADSVFGEVTTDSVGATIVIAEGPNPCVLGTSSSREEYDGCLETNQDSPSQMCLDAAKLLPRFYEALIEAEPDADWGDRRDERFGS